MVALRNVILFVKYNSCLYFIYTDYSVQYMLFSGHTIVLNILFCFTGACRNITNSQCQMLPYNYTTVTSVLSIVKNIEMEKFLKFFSYLNRLNCYQHIMLFGCSLALPECISDGDDRYLRMKIHQWLEPIVVKYSLSNQTREDPN